MKVYTNDLYQYLYQSDKKTKDEIEKFEKIKQDKEVEGCTFRPETNYTKTKGNREKSVGIEEIKVISDKLSKFNHKYNKDEVLQKYANEKVKRDLEGCTFIPKVLKSSKRMAGEDSRGSFVDTFDFYDAVKKTNMVQLKIKVEAEKMKECTFKPSIRSPPRQKDRKTKSSMKEV